LLASDSHIILSSIGAAIVHDVMIYVRTLPKGVGGAGKLNWRVVFS
jgi:hypothetical protein